MLINVAQIDSTSLSAFIANSFSGAALSGSLLAYVNASGYLGNSILYVTGGDQIINGNKTFINNPNIPYTGGTGQAITKKYVDDQNGANITNYSGFAQQYFVSVSNNDYISGRKFFTGNLGVGYPIETGDAVNILYLSGVSGVIAAQIGSANLINVVLTSGIQTLSGLFNFTNEVFGIAPTTPSGFATKSYVDNLSITGVVYSTGMDQTISGIKTFVNSPIVPIATNSNQAVQLAQLNALGTVMGGVTGFGGVLSINGTSGASGNVYLQGAGTVTVSQCASIFYISGYTANNTQLYSAYIPIPSGNTGIQFVFNTGFNYLPAITHAIETTGNNNSFITPRIYNKQLTGFYVAFSSGIPDNTYFYNFAALPVISGSGFLGIQGSQGIAGNSPTPKGAWKAGVVFNTLDFIFQSGVSYITSQIHISDSTNRPAGTGNAYWQLFSSGAVGPTGYWVYQGDYNTGSIYVNGYSVTYNQSSYGYTGINPISGVTPDTTNTGWVVMALKGPIGYFINSGIITGNYVNMSFFFDPVGTGLALAEAFVSRTFNITGFALGCVNTGNAPLNGGILSGQLYERTLTNSKNNFQSFAFDTGIYSYVSGGLAWTVTGMSRIGLDVTNTLSGISQFSVGVFGFGIN